MIQVHCQPLPQLPAPSMGPQPHQPLRLMPSSPTLQKLPRLQSSNQEPRSRMDPPTWLSSMPTLALRRDSQNPVHSTSCSCPPGPQPHNSTHGSAGRAAGYCWLLQRMEWPHACPIAPHHLLPSQTKVAPHPLHPARGSRQGAWPTRHRDQEQQPVPNSVWTQHPSAAPLLPQLLPPLLLSLPLPLGWLREEAGAGLIMQKREGGGRRNREAQTERERRREG